MRPWLSWCFSFPAFLGWCIVIGWAVRDLVIHGDRLSDASAGVLAVGNWLWLALAWLGLEDAARMRPCRGLQAIGRRSP